LRPAGRVSQPHGGDGEGQLLGEDEHLEPVQSAAVVSRLGVSRPYRALSVVPQQAQEDQHRNDKNDKQKSRRPEVITG
jgi:hypothetical protein